MQQMILLHILLLARLFRAPLCPSSGARELLPVLFGAE